MHVDVRSRKNDGHINDLHEGELVRCITIGDISEKKYLSYTLNGADPLIIAKSIIRAFYCMCGDPREPTTKETHEFSNDFLGEIPPYNLRIPFSIVERWCSDKHYKSI